MTFSIRSILNYFYTVKHLEKRQVLSKIRYKVKSLLDNPGKFLLQEVPEFNGVRWNLKQFFLPPGLCNNTSKEIVAGELCFLNNKQKVGWPPDWSCNNLPKLWLYNLHYFEYLWCLDYAECKTLVLDWIKTHPPGPNQVGWEPYPVSLRLINLCGVFFDKYQNEIERDELFRNELWKSIYLQAQWLTKHLETHLLGNHLLENAAALILVGSCFGGNDANNWLMIGKGILEKEIPEQILDDGMHFELSPMYHCRIIYLFAIIFNTGNQELADLVKKPLGNMVVALRHLTHPDGQIALLNDSAFGIYNSPSQLISYINAFFEIKSSDFGNFSLPHAGYYGFRNDKGTYIVCDIGQIGPDYIPGHAHADIFSFELSLKGHRVIVDSGVHDYEISQMREYTRSTKAHNTLTVNGQDQCEMWAAFRVARRGRPYDTKWVPIEKGFRLSGWHDGYKRLKGKPVHFREFNWNKSARLTIKDIITASKTENVVSRLHLHPDCKINRLKDNKAWINYPKGEFRVEFFGNGKLSLEDSYYCSEFGIKTANKALAFSFSGSKIETRILIELL